MKNAEQRATAELVKAALRVHNYRERYTTPKRFTRGGEIHRMAYDHIWDKLEELEKARDAAVARLASIRRRR